MANTTLSAGGIFPDGTSVAAYNQRDVLGHAERREAPAVLTPVETQTVSGGSATFTTLVAKQPYLIYGKAGAAASTVDVTTPGDLTHDQVEVVTLRGFDGQQVSGGTFKITVDTGTGGPQTTGALPHDASAADVLIALEALSNVGTGDVVVTAADGGPYTLAWGGALANTAITTTVDANGLTGATKDNYVLVVGAS